MSIMATETRFFRAVLCFFIPALILAGCQSIPDPADYIVKKGGIYLVTSPARAQIWIDGTNSYKVTADSVYNLEAGSYIVTLKHFGYRDSTFTVQVEKGICDIMTINLAPCQLLDSVGSALVYAFNGSSEAKPAGITFSSGLANNFLNRDTVDFFYLEKDTTLRSPDYLSNSTVGEHKRVSYFLLSANKDINDLAPVPKQYVEGDPDWLSSVPDTTSGYFFVYDSDKHYSKILINKKILKTGTSPNSLEIIGYYNLIPDDLNFK